MIQFIKNLLNAQANAEALDKTIDRMHLFERLYDEAESDFMKSIKERERLSTKLHILRAMNKPFDEMAFWAWRRQRRMVACMVNNVHALFAHEVENYKGSEREIVRFKTPGGKTKHFDATLRIKSQAK